MMKKGICLLLTVLLIAGSLVACGGGTSAEDEAGLDFEALEVAGEFLGGLDPEAVVLEVEGARPVLWAEFYYDLLRSRNLLESGGRIADWDDVFEIQSLFDEEVSYNEFAIRFAKDAALARRAVEVLFYESGAELEEDFLAFYEEIRDFYMEQHGLDEAGFVDLLEENHLTEDVFILINEVSAMQTAIQTALYGEDGADVSEEEIEAFVESEGILRAKHILISAEEDGDEEATQRALELFEELQALSGDALFARFDEMIAAYGEDPGMEMNPDGYTFEPDVMVPEFTEGTESLAIGEVGEPVRSGFGYHIILRLPVQGDAVIMSMDGSQQTVAAVAGVTLVRDALEEIRAELSYEGTEFLEEIVPSTFFVSVAEELLAGFDNQFEDEEDWDDLEYFEELEYEEELEELEYLED